MRQWPIQNTWSSYIGTSHDLCHRLTFQHDDFHHGSRVHDDRMLVYLTWTRRCSLLVSTPALFIYRGSEAPSLRRMDGPMEGGNLSELTLGDDLHIQPPMPHESYSDCLTYRRMRKESKDCENLGKDNSFFCSHSVTHPTR